MSRAQVMPPGPSRDGADDSPGPPLSDRQLADLGRWYEQYLDRARRVAAKFAAEQDVDDVVQTAVTRLLDACTRASEPHPFPETEDGFRRFFLTIVRNAARDYARAGTDGERSNRDGWGRGEPSAPRRNVPDRSLALDAKPVTADDADAAEPDAEPVTRGARERVYDAPQDEPRIRFDEFTSHIWLKVLVLPYMQHDVIFGLYYHDYDRARVASEAGVSPKTLDTHRYRGLKNLRRTILDWPMADAYDDNPWRDLICRMHVRWMVRRRRMWRGEQPSHPGQQVA
jgi:RNA polymerase sigma factor (sigma-70 family)